MLAPRPGNEADMLNPKTGAAAPKGAGHGE